MTAELQPTATAGAAAFAPLAPPPPLPEDDQAARDRIVSDLDTNLLVEAGAGSGKTTSLVGRMLALVARGTPVDRIAAVTFTRKAAHELRERFQLELERRVRETPAGSEQGQRYDRALRELDRAFLGTIHAFCARLLRERPLEVGLDPNFQEVSEEPWEELRQDFWRRWVERALRGDDADLAALRRVGVDPRALAEGFALVMAYPDVDFPVGDGAPPDAAPCRRELEALLAAARALMPRDEPAAGWDSLMSLVRRLDFHRSVNDWGDVERFCAAVEGIAVSHCTPTQNRWSDTKEGKAAAKELGQSFLALLEERVADLLRCWREHRYPVVVRFLRRAAEEFARERHATGQLGFEDLLLLTARLLRESPAVRAELGGRYAYLLVDEFQDTDPIQAEVCFLLASDASEGTDWRTVVPRPGSLFVVGDPKQSIYRFRRADIQTYELVKRRLAACGAVLALTRNFRSVRPVERLVNDHFGGADGAFPAEATAEQAPFRPMQTVKEAAGADGVYRYTLRMSGRAQHGELLALDAGAVASWIADRVARGERQAGDFLILTATKAPIERYARALAERNVPVTTTGARLPQERELAELLVVLRAVADPENAVAVVAALEGMFFGLSPADLWSARQAELRFSITHRPSDEAHPVGRALLQLHAWWQLAQRHPADVLIERLLDDTGLLVHAASQPLGEARAGALLHLVAVLRAGTARGGSGITDAMEQLALLLKAEAADAPLRPGRSDAVRVMNLHKAKGLEADVVVLAAPLDRDPPDPAVHVSRGDGDGRPVGGLCLSRKERNTRLVIAQPPGWAAMQAKEGAFRSAEEARLRYVAVTRAKRELVVAQVERTTQKGVVADTSMWRPLAPKLDGMAAHLDLTVRPAPGRRRVVRDVGSMQEAVAAAAQGVRDASAASLRIVTVTESVKEQRAAERAYDLPRPDAAGTGNGGGAAWGRAVHRAVEALGRGRRGPALATFVRAVARDEGIDEARCGELQLLLDEIARSDAWRRLAAAGGTPSFELTVMRRSMDGGQEVVTEGVVDAASLGPEGWYVVDWKSDLVDDAAWAARQEQYGRQVAAYVEMLRDLTGQSGHGRVERVRPVGDRSTT